MLLANPGEGIEGGTVTAVFVKAGDAVKTGQALVEVSTDKASMEVTAEADGTIEAVHVKPGDKVAVGGKLVTLKASGGRQPSETTPIKQPVPESRQPVPDSGAYAPRSPNQSSPTAPRPRRSSPPDPRRANSRANSASRSRK